MRWLLLPLTCLLLACGLLSAAQASEHARGRLVELTNESRHAHHLRPLAVNGCLARAAQVQAEREARRETMYHQDLGPLLRRCHLTHVGENVAYGYPNPRAFERAWMHSAGHRANILNAHYSGVGVGLARGENGLLYASVVFGGGHG